MPVGAWSRWSGNAKWNSTGTPEPQEVSVASEEIPFGLRISSDCHHLEDDPLEMQTLKFLAEMIVQDISFKSMAEALNIREYRTRDGRPWNAASALPAYASPDRRRPTHPLRRGMGDAQETTDARRLELLTPYLASERPTLSR